MLEYAFERRTQLIEDKGNLFWITNILKAQSQGDFDFFYMTVRYIHLRSRINHDDIQNTWNEPRMLLYWFF
jgi:hypothetical protein